MYEENFDETSQLSNMLNQDESCLQPSSFTIKNIEKFNNLSIPSGIPPQISFKNSQLAFNVSKANNDNYLYQLNVFNTEIEEKNFLYQTTEEYYEEGLDKINEYQTENILSVGLKNESLNDYIVGDTNLPPDSTFFNYTLSQYLESLIDFSNFEESLRNLYNLSVKVYEGITISQAQRIFKHKLKRLLMEDDDLLTFVTNFTGENDVLVEELIHIYKNKNKVEELTISDIYDDLNNSPHYIRRSSISRKICDHCQFMGHDESVCRKKMEGKPKGDYTKKSPFYRKKAHTEKYNKYHVKKQHYFSGKIIKKIATLNVNDINCDVLFDTGSDVSYIHHNFVRQLNLQTIPINTSIKSITGVLIQKTAAVIYFTINKIKYEILAYISSNSILKDIIVVGNDFLDRFQDFVMTNKYVRLDGEFFYFHQVKIKKLSEINDTCFTEYGKQLNNGFSGGRKK